MWWLIVWFLERLEAAAAAAGLTQLAGEVCHVATALGMVGPCLPS